MSKTSSSYIHEERFTPSIYSSNLENNVNNNQIRYSQDFLSEPDNNKIFCIVLNKKLSKKKLSTLAGCLTTNILLILGFWWVSRRTWSEIDLSKVTFQNRTIPLRLDIGLQKKRSDKYEFCSNESYFTAIFHLFFLLHELCIQHQIFKQRSCSDIGLGVKIGGFHIGNGILRSGTFKFVLYSCDTILVLLIVGLLFLASIGFAKEEYMERVGFSTAGLCGVLAGLLAAILRCWNWKLIIFNKLFNS